LIPLIQATKTTSVEIGKTSESKTLQEATSTISETQQSKSEQGENKFLKDITKFDYNLLVSRMAENLPGSFLTNAYVYVVDGEIALKIAKLTQNYILDRVSGGKYIIVTPTNIMPEHKPTTKGFDDKNRSNIQFKRGVQISGQFKNARHKCVQHIYKRRIYHLSWYFHQREPSKELLLFSRLGRTIKIWSYNRGKGK